MSFHDKIRERQAAWWHEDDRVMSAYDDILAELKIANKEIQLIRVTLERLAKQERPSEPSLTQEACDLVNRNWRHPEAKR